MININTKDLKQLKNNLENTSKSAYPLSVRSTLNRQAFETSKQSKEVTIPENFELRNGFIQKTVGYERSDNVFDIPAMQALAGQFSSFKGKPTNQLEHQEYGKPVIAKGKYTKAPTLSARGGAYSRRIKKSALFSSLKQNKIKTIKDIAEYPAKYPIAQAIGIVSRYNETVNLVATTKKGVKGVFKITKKGAQLLYKFTDKANKIKKREWLKPASEKALKNSDKYFAEEAERRMQKEMSKNLKKL